VAVAGNIGPTLLDTWAERIDAATLPEVWVLELSSFQLDGVPRDFEPTAATVLNITQDHLDWHGDMQAYAAAKARIFGEAGAHGAQPRRPAGDGHAAAAGARQAAKAPAARHM
jgi:UDP-N-acetylmuramoylalanine--D-glutamate ligase